MLLTAIIFINLAGLCYTLAVFAEKMQKILKRWHVVIFCLGLLFDTVGTTAMSKISGAVLFNFHGLTGLLAIFLMGIHTIWAIWVLYAKDNNLKIKFHKFSTIVWIIWLIPMLSGIILSV
ncbi:MAG: TIGR03987 family protein [Pelosinus sp.]|nr:TIGR03987 family protein [Pelosinus sp.]